MAKNDEIATGEMSLTYCVKEALTLPPEGEYESAELAADEAAAMGLVEDVGKAKLVVVDVELVLDCG